MKKLFYKVIFFSLLLSFLCIIVFYNADGHADGIYLKFTTPKQSALILGTSKASQGLHPAIFNNVLNRNDVYNYAFTVMHSPYGPAYYRSIQKKIQHNPEKPGIFIVTVDPYSISVLNGKPNERNEFREEKLAMGQMESVTGFPNFEYLIYHYDLPYIYLLTRKLNYVSQGVLHEDGWVETQNSKDRDYILKNTNEKIQIYSESYKDYQFSEVRMQYLVKTIEYLKEFGEVYLVRLPTIKALWKFEDLVVPEFDERISRLAETYKVPYFNYKNYYSDEVQKFDDGNHLNAETGKIFSYLLAKRIQQYSNRPSPAN